MGNGDIIDYGNMLSRETYESIVANLTDKKTHERQSERLRSVASKFPK